LCGFGSTRRAFLEERVGIPSSWFAYAAADKALSVGDASTYFANINEISTENPGRFFEDYILPNQLFGAKYDSKLEQYLGLVRDESVMHGLLRLLNGMSEVSKEDQSTVSAVRIEELEGLAIEVQQQKFESRVVISSGNAKTECLTVDHAGVVVTAQRTNTINPQEGAKYAFDGDLHTKWLDYAGSKETTWLHVTLKNPETVTKYAIVSANDAPKRDPTSWRLEGRTAPSVAWTKLDERNNQVFPGRLLRRTFPISKPTSFQQYRLTVTANATGADAMQMADLQLWVGSACSDPCCGVKCGRGKCVEGLCVCEHLYWGASCENKAAEFVPMKGRRLTNKLLVYYGELSVKECQTRCTVDWGKRCVGVTMQHTSDGSICRLYQGVSPALRSALNHDSYMSVY